MTSPSAPLPPNHFLNSRPTAYGQDLCPELTLAGRVRGTYRRLVIQNAYDSGTIDRLPERIFAEKLTQDEIEAIANGPVPKHLSGERLPALEQDEVEIARVICWAIKKGPVIALYARPLGDEQGYTLRFVNEFERPITDYPSTIPRTLFLTELINLLNDARFGDRPGGVVWYLAIGCVRHGWPVDELIRGVAPVSAFYQNLKPCYRAAFADWFKRNPDFIPPSDPKTITENSGETTQIA